MSFQLPPNPAPAAVKKLPSNAVQAGVKTYISLPPEQDYAPAGFFPAKFVIIAILAAGALTLAGLIQTGKISLNRSSSASKAPAQTPSVLSWVTNSLSAAKAASAANSARVADDAPAAGRLASAKAAPIRKMEPVAKAAPAAPVPPLNPKAFTVTSISIGQPSIAIINGVSRVAGDPVEAPGVTGWKVRQILDDAVILQNGATQATLPLSTPGINPLNDQLHPLN